MQSACPFRAISGLSRCSLRAGQMPATEAAGQEATKRARRHPMIIASRRITPHEILLLPNLTWAAVAPWGGRRATPRQDAKE